MTNPRYHFGYPDGELSTTDLSVANIIAHGGQIPLYDYAGQEFEIGQVVFFEFNTGCATLPRKGRITKINTNKQKIKVLSDRSGGYEPNEEPDTPAQKKYGSSGYWMFGASITGCWREFWIDMNACPIVIGDKTDKIYYC